MSRLLTGAPHRAGIVVRGNLLAAPAFGVVDFNQVCRDSLANVHCTFTGSERGLKVLDHEAAARQIAQRPRSTIYPVAGCFVPLARWRGANERGRRAAL